MNAYNVIFEIDRIQKSKVDSFVKVWYLIAVHALTGRFRSYPHCREYPAGERVHGKCGWSPLSLFSETK